MSENKAMIVRFCCEAANCEVPNPGELAFEYVYESYQEGVNYARDGEDYPISELIENQIPYNNYEVATIWTELQLYYNGIPSRNRNFIQEFQYMLFEVTEDFINKGIERSRM